MKLRDLIPFKGNHEPGEKKAIAVERKETEPSFFDGLAYDIPNVMEHVGGMANMDIRESKNCMTLHLELPGVDAEDIQIFLEDNVLTIRGEKRKDRDVMDGHTKRLECCYGYFERNLALPGSATLDAIDAHFGNGVLTIRIPKTPAVQTDTRQIAVKSE